MQFASSPGFEPFCRCICERESLNGLDGNGLQSFRLSQWNEIFFERNLSRILFICVFVCFKGRIELPLTDELNPYLQNVRGVVAASMASMAMASNPSGSHNGVEYFLKGMSPSDNTSPGAWSWIEAVGNSANTDLIR